MFGPPQAPAPMQASAPQQQYYAQPYAQPPQYYAAPPQSRALPTWLLSILFALAFVGLFAGGYWVIQHLKGDSTTTAASGTAPAATTPGAKPRPNPYEKYVEITGVRLFQDAKKKVVARFLVVNHMEGEMTDVAGTVDIRGRTAKEGEEPVGTFQFKVASIGPNEAKEVTAPVDTKLKVYELPDWQMIDAKVRLAPQ
jgi:hypothetical protein